MTEQILSHDQSLYRAVQRGPWQSYEKIEPKPIADTRTRYTGAKIPMAELRKALSFLQWGYDETGCEVVCHFAQNADTGDWRAVVMAQQGYNGLTVHPLPDDPAEGQLATLAALGAGEWSIAGSIHGHCRISAFQSSGDERDEKRYPGFHITIGNQDKLKKSWHARAVVNGKTTPAVLSDWLELDPMQEIALPASLITEFGERLLQIELETHPEKDAFPADWKARVRKPAPKQPESFWSDWTYDPKTGAYTRRKQELTHEHDKRLLPAHYQPSAARDNRQIDCPLTERDRKRLLVADLLEIARDYDCDIATIEHDLGELADDYTTGLVQCCADFSVTPSEAIEALQDYQFRENETTELTESDLLMDDIDAEIENTRAQLEKSR